MHRYGGLLVMCLMLLARVSFAQEWGDLEAADSLVDWALGPVLLIIVELALAGVILYAIWNRDLVLGLIGFSLVCIIGGVAAVVPDIAVAVTGSEM